MAIVVYTDGSVRPYLRVPGARASWAFVAVERKCPADHIAGSILEWDAGEVATDVADPAFIGAERHTVNTGELTAVYWALSWLHRRKEKSATVYTDSQYARRAVRGINAAISNGDLVQRVRGVCIGTAYRVLWVKAHAGHRWNELADRFAKEQLNGVC